MCVKPLKGIVYGINPENGKKRIKVVKDFYVPTDNDNVIPIPCGKCIECRLNHARVWSDRMMAEASYYVDNVFLTLTYDDSHLPEPFTRLNPETGDIEVSPVHPLVKRDFQLFIKRLRKSLPDQKIRYYACGEYGDQSMRPHYHAILFNCRLDDAKLFYTNDSGYSYFTSDIISSCWYSELDADKPASSRSPMGYHFLASVNWNTCNYVARYVTKKLIHGYDDLPDKLNYPREFSLMSRRPGIGYQYYQDHKTELDLFNEAFLADDLGARRIRMNKYYDHLLELDDSYMLELLKLERKEKAEQMELLSPLSFQQRNYNKEITLEAKTKNIRSRKDGIL